MICRRLGERLGPEVAVKSSSLLAVLDPIGRYESRERRYRISEKSALRKTHDHCLKIRVAYSRRHNTMMWRSSLLTNIVLLLRWEREWIQICAASLRVLEQQQEQQVVLLMTMLLLLLVLIMTMLLVLMIAIATRTSMLVSAANQKRDATSSSLKIEEVEGQCCNQDGCHTGIEPGACI